MPWLSLFAVLFSSSSPGAQSYPATGQGLYEIGCAKCHGSAGRGVDPSQVGFVVPLPDLTECSFATREPDADWIAVTHAGGPVRGFDATMPAFGEAFDVDQIQLIIDFIRGFCTEDDWPRGELNLPRALVTEKAYPEDELVWTTGLAADGPGELTNELLYERRFGARNQWELAVPLAWRQPGSGAPWRSGLGDVSLGVKRTLHHSLGTGTILSAIGEIAFPTGDEDDGLGTGSLIFEPSLSFGQLLPRDAFVQLQSGAELPATGEAEEEVFWRVVLGRTFVTGRWGRSFTPMLEILGAVAPAEGGVDWDVVPQLQLSLNRRQHVLANAGLRLAVTERNRRTDTVFVYVLWEWFDGGLLDGW